MTKRQLQAWAVEAAKRQSDIVGLARAAGVADFYKKRCTCPECGSSTGKLVAGKGLYCFKCERGFDAIALHRMATGDSFPQAVRVLCHRLGLRDEDITTHLETSPPPSLQSPPAKQHSELALDAVKELWQALLRAPPTALDGPAVENLLEYVQYVKEKCKT